MMPSIARNDPAYPEQDYWRGRIWAPMNYLAYLALRRHRSENDAAEACKVLAEKSKNLLLQEWTLHGHVHENYDGDSGMGCGVRNSDKFYHWGALLALIALLEDGYVQGPEKKL
jgi:glycogen debranching enzyme